VRADVKHRRIRVGTFCPPLAVCGQHFRLDNEFVALRFQGSCITSVGTGAETPQNITEASRRTKPVPSTVRAIAALKYAQEVQHRKIEASDSKAADEPGNPLGII